MANVYVRSGAAGGGTGADWTNAYTTLAAAFAAKAAGDTFWVSEDHAETQGSAMTLTSPGTAAAPCRVIGVNHAGTVPPVTADLRDPISGTSGSLTTTGAFTLTFGNGYTYWYGLTFSCGTGSVANAVTISGAGENYFKSCILKKAGTSTNAGAISAGGTTTAQDSHIILDNTKVQFGAVGDGISVRSARFEWKNTPSAIAGATIPTTQLFGSGNSTPGNLINVEGVDMSALGACPIVLAQTGTSRFRFRQCKLGSSYVASGTQTLPGVIVDLIQCDSGALNYKTERHCYQGDLTTETTIIHTGGANDGTQGVSWKVLTTANPQWHSPFECPPIVIWNDTVGSVTVTVEGIWTSGSTPTNAQIWMDVEYLGTASFPLAIGATMGLADPLASAANLTTSSETWGGSTTKFKLSKTITTTLKGPIVAYVKIAAASSVAIYIDPKITLT